MKNIQAAVSKKSIGEELFSILKRFEGRQVVISVTGAMDFMKQDIEKMQVYRTNQHQENDKVIDINPRDYIVLDTQDAEIDTFKIDISKVYMLLDYTEYNSEGELDLIIELSNDITIQISE